VREPGNARLVGGVWLPDTEEHFEEMMLRNKRMRVVDGKHTYQYHKIEAAMRFQPIDRRRVCLDIGAHVGLWAMWLTKWFDVVHSFEPVPWFANIYPYNVNMEKARLYPVALGDRADEVSISVPEDMTGNSHIAIPGRVPDRRDGHGDVRQCDSVSMIPLDSLEFADVDFIKIDVEGYELQVVQGAVETIKRWSPNIVIEQKGNEQAYGQPRDAACSFLRGLGMRDLQVISGDHIMGW
jgi:FkbM family methyltransferase